MADENPNPNPVDPPKPKGETSDDVVSGKWSAVIKKLETKNATLEDRMNKLQEENVSLKTIVEKVAAVPSKTVKGKSLLDEITEFIFPVKKNENQNPPATS